MNNPWVILGASAIAAYVFRIWWLDFRAARQGEEIRSPMPGATTAPMIAVVISVIGGLVILGAEVGGEYAIGLPVEEQSDMALLFCAYSILIAPFVEELIFRGFIYYDQGSRALLMASCAAASVAFALLHPYLLAFEMPEGAPAWQFWRGFGLDLSGQGSLSTTILVVNSLWWYSMRFCWLNPKRSLIPCFASHAASNLGVVLIKLEQGKILWTLVE